ncbi:MAG: polysaccharide deacetylase family protein [Calditrichaceae bacterium]|nr:polysaccharide deacetylase family protein [Calditrichaceae bacterium]
MWNNKKCAVVLTYDDGLNVHLDNVLPALDSLGLRGTFYIPANSTCLRDRLAEWRVLAEKGNEIGNHTLFHPCDGRPAGRDWVNPNYDLATYTIDRIVDEIKLANTFLYAVDGKTDRTFAYTCGEKTAGDSLFVPLIKDDFIAARNVNAILQSINEINLFDIPSYLINGESGEEMIKLVKNAMENNALLVFLFHGVGGEHGINVSLKAHNQLLHYLKENENNFWVAPLVEVAEYINSVNTQISNRIKSSLISTGTVLYK